MELLFVTCLTSCKLDMFSEMEVVKNGTIVEMGSDTLAPTGGTEKK